jgi:hypothetical protein
MEEKKKQRLLVPGEKVVYLPEMKVYDFGYMGQTGKAVIYEEGECNMQDAIAVDPANLERLVKN